MGSATQKLAKMVSHKYYRNGVKTDLLDNHDRSLSKAHIQNIAEVGTIAMAKEEV